jgi:hypothetical protein
LLAFCQSPLADEPARVRWPLQAQLLDALERGNEADLPAASRIAGISLAAALEVLAKWCHDLARVQAGGTPRFLPSATQHCGESPVAHPCSVSCT